MSLVRRKLSLQFQLGTGTFGESGADTVTVEGLRASASISKSGGVGMSSLQLRVFGMNLDVMNQLSTLGKPLLDGRNNTITVMAGDEGSAMATAFVGIISEAWVDANNAPEIGFEVTAQTGLVDALKPVPPYSAQGSADAATIMSSLAQLMGYTFENGGVSVQLSNPYFPGTARDQAYECARAGNFNVVIDDTTLAIWPIGGTRSAATVSLSSDIGMIGYPAHTQNGIVVETLYNPAITFGASVQVTSELSPATGTWSIFGVSHVLEVETVGGKWHTTLQCSVLGHDQPIAK